MFVSIKVGSVVCILIVHGVGITIKCERVVGWGANDAVPHSRDGVG